MQANITIKGLNEQLKRLDPKNADRIAKFGLTRLVGRFENRVGLEADKTVYSYKPKTNTYQRTGRLLGGRGRAMGGGKPDTKKLNDYTVRAEANPMLKGASFNYAPFVEAGKGWMRRVGARPFWTNSVNWTKTTGIKLTQKEMSDEIKKL